MAHALIPINNNKRTGTSATIECKLATAASVDDTAENYNCIWNDCCARENQHKKNNRQKGPAATLTAAAKFHINCCRLEQHTNWTFTQCVYI